MGRGKKLQGVTQNMQGFVSSNFLASLVASIKSNYIFLWPVQSSTLNCDLAQVRCKNSG